MARQRQGRANATRGAVNDGLEVSRIYGLKCCHPDSVQRFCRSVWLWLSPAPSGVELSCRNCSDYTRAPGQAESMVGQPTGGTFGQESGVVAVQIHTRMPGDWHSPTQLPIWISCESPTRSMI